MFDNRICFDLPNPIHIISEAQITTINNEIPHNHFNIQ